MKKHWLALIIIVALIIIIAVPLVSGYSSMAASREQVDSALAQLQSPLQRRVDLIPSLLETVKGYAAHEEEIMNQIADARAALSAADTPAALAEADEALTGALANLQLEVENYPALQANRTFIGLMDELAGTENSVAAARNSYNEAVQRYNAMLARFPRNILAGLFGFGPAEYFR